MKFLISFEVQRAVLKRIQLDTIEGNSSGLDIVASTVLKSPVHCNRLCGSLATGANPQKRATAVYSHKFRC